MSGHSCHRYHDFCAGHRVAGHENKCAALHGHNYRVHFYARTIAPNGVDLGLDKIGRVVDFAVLKKLGDWLEEHWDHKMLLWKFDPHMPALWAADASNSIVELPFNPTAENMAEYLCRWVGTPILEPYGVELFRVVVEETRKCSAEYSR